MRYMGGKSRIAKALVPILTKNLTEERWYVEPFAGGMNMMCNINHSKRIASDSNNYIIAMWTWLVNFNKLFPLKISKDIYSYFRNKFNSNGFSGVGITEEEAMIGWIGFMGSFNGRFFDGGYSGHNVKGRDYIGEQIRNTLYQVDKLKVVYFCCGSYEKINIPDNSVIYCDPPYQGTKQYSTSKNFDHERFWEWCRFMTDKGHDVLVSEYNAPEDFVCIWSKKVTNSMNTKNTYYPEERLFVHKSIADKYISNELKLF